MAVPPQEPGRGNPTDQYPLLTERTNDTNMNNDHVIHIHRRSDASSSNLSDYDNNRSQNPSDREGRDRSGSRVPNSPSSSSSPPENNASSSSVARRNEESDRRHWSPLNSGFWISIELVFTLSQITAAVIVVLLSRHEKPRAPLFLWIEGYTAGCIASLPLLYWRYVHRNLGAEQRTSQPSQDTPRGNSGGDQSSYINISVDQASEQQEDRANTSTVTANGQTRRTTNPRLILLVDHLKMALDCFFAIWFVLGNVWIFGGHSSASDAPNLYRLCIVYLTLSGIGYAMPFILCAMICCCLPCIISMLGIREEHNQIRGASEDSINALPAHKFKLKKSENDEGSEEEETNSDGPEEGGVVAAGTEKERVISSEDAVCCICLARYVDNDELRELPCSHFFHAECVDKWLRINATCPLCKCEIGEKSAEPPSTSQPNSSMQA